MFTNPAINVYSRDVMRLVDASPGSPTRTATRSNRRSGANSAMVERKAVARADQRPPAQSTT
jgi:hypothetical protein